MYNRGKRININAYNEALRLRDNPDETKSRRADIPFNDVGVGNVTYESCHIEELYGNIFVGTAERNYFVDSYHEICICVHYNRRTPGTYKFDENYQFLVTNERKSLDIFWNLGNIDDVSSIVERYGDIAEAKDSLYYQDFCDLKELIIKRINESKKNRSDPFAPGCMSFGTTELWGKEVSVYQIPYKPIKRVIQFYLDDATKELILITDTPIDIFEHLCFMSDFFEVDKSELHMVNYVSLVNGLPPEDTIYSELYKNKVLEHLNRPKIPYY